MLPHYIHAVLRRAPELDIRDRLLTAINTNNRDLLRSFR
jgi:hypothetical protein